MAFVALFSTQAYAADNDHTSCNVNITSDIVFANNQLTVQSTKQEAILFKSDGSVFVDNKRVTLSENEKEISKSYYKEVESAIPVVVDITVDALTLTEAALAEVFTGLLGPQTKVPSNLTYRISDVANTIKTHVYQDPKSLTFNSAELKNEIGVGSELDAQIEQIKAEVVSSIMGQLIVAVGQSMMTGGTNFSELESRMTNLAQNIEQKAELLGNNLKEKSVGLCDSVKKLDATEAKLRQIAKLQHLNTFEFYNKD